MNLLTLTLIVGIPVAIWIVSYAYLARYNERWNLLHVPIHESGRHTLLGTIFYFNHFLREIFIDTLFVLAAFSTYRIVHPGNIMPIHSVLIPGAFLVFLAVVFLGSIRDVGLKNTLLDLFQFRELDHVVKFGSHWQMHFLSTFVILLLLVLPAFFSATQTPQTLIAVGLLFLLASIFFRTGWLAISDPRWILHGGREIITFFILAVLPFYGVVFPGLALRPSWPALWGVAALSGCLIYYAWVYRKTELRHFAQGGYGVVYLLTSHFFEHVLDYVYICLLMVVLLQQAG